MLTLASDFGSPYPAAMKGAILSRTDAQLVDVTHDLPRQDVRAAAFWLREVFPTFPPAVHLAVVDPGVGTDRAVLALKAGDHVLVGPDNGLLLPAARRLSDDISAYHVAFDEPASTTFHGRDVFAPLAAEIHERGAEILAADDRFTHTHEYETVTFPEPDSLDGAVRGDVLVVDGFGNAITNVPGTVLDGHVGTEVIVNGESVPARRTYAAVEHGQRLVTVGSHDNVELAVNRGRGEDGFGVGPGDRVVLELS
ncbi:SAM hydrolase/SAM-dependent halogenase family protein [Halanaeroarchaeum sulfurireducens]|uniref:S-adenosylmethionine hydroxide adenosyltransferase n=1 Tax=Halanaeroarchaeum sulfurireducens TaxID=1604004 RepID=A0A0F7P7C7_9EURY|nr:SAM-dependent chlorinase/fluorinase [Halanaeroarchaeum sulfurireducens]AKH97111.1 S-adenosylmethionine hydroxide adenosyltransferase [Halanaeroarchaeum sulfurireducens]ALG81512.1 S-adenosylmethionine hydroxide adenosyltransferase [Halanaeroarchaeum sulfurireducens]